MKTPKTLADLQKDPRVKSVEHDSDGWWAYLKTGWSWDGEVHAVHEDTIGQLLYAFRWGVKPCRCQDCSLRGAL